MRAIARLARLACSLVRVLPGLALLAAPVLAVAASPVLDTARFNDGAEVDTAPVGRRVAVVLVHGFGGSTEGWEPFLRAYAKTPAWRATFKPYTFRYSSSATEIASDPAAPKSIRAVGAALRDGLQAWYGKPPSAPSFGFGPRRVVLLAHSMGGLVARSMMQEQVFADGERGGDKVTQLITLGTPHLGSPLADAMLSLGRQVPSELAEVHAGFAADLTWTNHDGLDMSGARCNPWLAQLNHYWPRGGATLGRCGRVEASPLRGYYEKLAAWGARTLQQPDLDTGGTGVFEPGSSTALLLPYAWMYGGLSRSYGNDGIVPMISAQFEGAPLARRAEAHACDHRYIRRGYPALVRTATSTYTDWAFCAAVGGQPPQPSGAAGGYAVTGSIFGAPGGVVDSIRTVAEAERVLDWAQQAYAAFLKPATSATDVGEGFLYRHYPASGAHAGVRDGVLWYRGPASGGTLLSVGRVADLLPLAEAAGF